jgi:radical SAM protein
MLVFWETTRACGLACRHCRASATPEALPGQLTHDEGLDLIDQVAAFGRPHPILVLTGGDCLLRQDLFELVDRADSLDIPVALSPSVTPLLTPEAIHRIADSPVRAVSISLDGAIGSTHDGVRGIEGHFEQTVQAIRDLVATGLTVQVNTTVMRTNVEELSEVARIVSDTGARIWEVFFLIHVGRGTDTLALNPDEHEQVCHFLYDSAHYGFIVRTVEAPFFRRVARARAGGATVPDGNLYRRLATELREQLGDPGPRPKAHTAATRDGKGILFIAHDGEVYPAGFLPLGLGNIRDQPISRIYCDDERLQAIRAARFSGRCGECEYADLCGGSRARAYVSTGDLLGEDPACVHRPARRELPSTGV